jgi:hypothetical protein
VRSIRNKFIDIQAEIVENKYDIVALTESWLNSDDGSDYLNEYRINGYTLLSKERTDRRGGGVLLYVRHHLGPNQKTMNVIDNIDCISIEIKNTRNKKIIIALYYRPPNQSADTDSKIIEQIQEIINTSDAIILGDFNLPVKNWGDHYNTTSGRALYEYFIDSELQQVVMCPTRGDNLLDIVLTTDRLLINSTATGELVSDHKSILIDMAFENKNTNITKTRVNFSAANFTGMRDNFAKFLSTINLKVLHAEESWEIIKRELVKLQDKFIPLREVNSNSIAPRWWNKNVKRALTNKKGKFKRYKNNPNQLNWELYANQRRVAKNILRISKRSYENKIAENSKKDPKTFFQYVKSRKTTSDTINTIETSAGNTTTDNSEISDILNTYFASVFTVEECNELPVVDLASGVNLITDYSISNDDIMKAISRLKISKSSGPDQIYARTIKELQSLLCEPLKEIFNKSLVSGTVPVDWKRANVTPIFKKGAKSKPQNYRPISLTSLIGKLLESIIRDKIVEHLEENNLIAESQHGFRLKRSCLTNLLDFNYEVIKAHEKHKAVDIAYLDFQKAFDKVPHKRLLIKLNSMGIQGNLLQWVENWLDCRSQRVVINGAYSDWTEVTSGVPQGSVLGPTLFLCYINDIDKCVTNYISKFADDTKIMSPSESHEKCDVLQRDIISLNNWANKWQMCFNVEKCKIMHVGNKNIGYQYSMNGKHLSETKSERDLGVVFDNNLKVGQNCTTAIKKANKTLGLIFRTFEHKDASIVISMYKSLVRPHLEYCVQAWAPHYQKDIDRLERVQRRATKMVPNLRHLAYEDRLKKLNMFTLKRRRARADLVEIYKLIHGIDRLDILKYIKFAESNTRGHSLKLLRSTTSSEIEKYEFFRRIIGAWNSLPDNVVTCGSLPIFKIRLDAYMDANELDFFADQINLHQYTGQ